MGRRRKRRQDHKHDHSPRVDWNDPWDAFEAVRDEEEREQGPPTGPPTRDPGDRPSN